jgi:hypothetical protein
MQRGSSFQSLCFKTKDGKGDGARGCCVECGRKTNTFCIVCKKWLCNIQLPVNRPGVKEVKENMDEPKFILLTFDDGTFTKKSVPSTHVGINPINHV